MLFEEKRQPFGSRFAGQCDTKVQYCFCKTLGEEREQINVFLDPCSFITEAKKSLEWYLLSTH